MSQYAWCIVWVACFAAGCQDKAASVSEQRDAQDASVVGMDASTPSMDASTVEPDAGCPSVVGATEERACGMDVQTFVACCNGQGGVTAGGCTSPNCFNGMRCYPRVVPAAQEWPCSVLSCQDTQYCVLPRWQGDGCLYPLCFSPTSACAGTPTCACATANYLFGSTHCSEDDAGHATIETSSTLP